MRYSSALVGPLQGRFEGTNAGAVMLGEYSLGNIRQQCYEHPRHFALACASGATLAFLNMLVVMTYNPGLMMGVVAGT